MAIKDYQEAGFNSFLVREFPVANSSQRDLLSEDDFDSLVDGVSGSKITSGISRSKDGTLRVDWDRALISFNNGLNQVFQVGKFDDGTSGVRIMDSKGNIISLNSLELKMNTPVVPGAINTARLFVDNNGVGGRNRLLVQFFRGAPRVLATEPT